MLSLRLDPDLERLLERDVDDLAKYNILRYLHENPEVRDDVAFFADRLGLRSLDRVEEALEGLVRCGLLVKLTFGASPGPRYQLSRDHAAVEMVDRLYRLSSTSFYGEIVERLAARSLHRARRSQPVLHGGIRFEE
jgi:hypothetical protein